MGHKRKDKVLVALKAYFLDSSVSRFLEFSFGLLKIPRSKINLSRNIYKNVCLVNVWCVFWFLGVIRRLIHNFFNSKEYFIDEKVISSWVSFIFIGYLRFICGENIS